MFWSRRSPTQQMQQRLLILACAMPSASCRTLTCHRRYKVQDNSDSTVFQETRQHASQSLSVVIVAGSGKLSDSESANACKNIF
mmetsp:Transcript_10171/g.16209  ORF Transcript_10171/g.16209 Transcript_10171/m.16209 type:complete len:84 (-) Transcript_10171:64-315(-)